MTMSRVLRAGIGLVFVSALFLAGCDIGDVSISISGTPQKGEQLTADVTGQIYGDIDWLWSPADDFMESYVLSSGPSRVITVPSIVNPGGINISSNGNYIRARVDSTGTGLYVYSNVVGPITD